MPLPGLAELTFLYKAKEAAKRLLKSPWFYVVLAFVAIGAGTFIYLKNDKAEAVDQAVSVATEQADSRATVRTLETRGRVQDSYAQIDRQADGLRQQTTKDYENVRTRIIYAPVEQKDAAVPPLIIDTVNELDRLRSVRDRATPAETGVRDPEVPAG